MTHGTNSAYANGCRCQPCRDARREYDQLFGYKRRQAPSVDRELLGEVLRELFPFGLTDQCPARRKLRAEE